MRLLRLTAAAEGREQQIEVIRNSVTPESREVRGWLGALLLTQSAGGIALSGSFWASAEALEDSEAGGHYRRQLDKFKGLWIAPPDREVLQVAVHRFQDMDSARVARVTTLPIRLGTEREVERIYRDDVLPQLVAAQGFCGTMLLPRPVKSIGITLFESMPQLLETEASGFYSEQVAKMDPFLSGDPVKEHFDVSLFEIRRPAPA